MRGDDQICGSLFSYVDLEVRIGAEHSLPAIREIANTALAALWREFEALYSGLERPSIPRKAAVGNAVAGLPLGALGAAIERPTRAQHRHHLCPIRARPRVGLERANKTLQDRLVREFWLAGAATLAEGNAVLPAFIADYNARFAKAPANNKDLHRPLRAGDDLDDAYAWKEERTLSQALTLQQGPLHPGAE